MPSKCIVEKCNEQLAFGGLSMKRGLCAKCYKKAKDMIELGSTTWEQLEAMGLAKSQGDDPFTEAFNAANQQQ